MPADPQPVTIERSQPGTRTARGRDKTRAAIAKGGAVSASTPVPKDHPLMKAWEAHKATEDFSNSRKWALHEEHLDGSLWALFSAGWQAAQPDTIQAARYRWIVTNPESARHLLHLLQQGKGDADGFAKLVDRIEASERAARAPAVAITVSTPEGAELASWQRDAQGRTARAASREHAIRNPGAATMTEERNYRCPRCAEWSRQPGWCQNCRQLIPSHHLALLNCYAELRANCAALEEAIACAVTAEPPLTRDEQNRLDKGVTVMKVGFKLVKKVLRAQGHTGNLKTRANETAGGEP
jgi:hypothetical protein